MSSNKDFLPSSSPISSICAIEIEAILYLFMMNCYKSSFQECITIIVLKIERTRNEPPYCLLQIQKRWHSASPVRVVLGLPSPSLRVCTGVRWRQNKNFGSAGYQIFLWCSASSAIKDTSSYVVSVRHRLKPILIEGINIQRRWSGRHWSNVVLNRC